MKLKALMIPTLVALGLAAAGQAAAQEKLTVWWGKGFYKAEDDALYAAIKKFEAKNPKVKVELSLYAPQEMIPKTVAALDAGNPPDVAYGDVYDFQVTAKWAFDGKLEDVTSVPRPDARQVRAAALATTFLYNDTDQEPRLLRLPDQAADDAHPVLEGHAGRGGLQGVGHPDRPGRATGASGATRCSRPTARRPASAASASAADGRGLERLVLLVPDLHGRLQRQAGQRRRQAAGRRSGGAPGPDQRADRLHRALHQGLHAAVGHQLEGPGQQRRLPQQDHRDDAQRDDLDRRQVARRHEQRDAHARAARRRPRRTTPRRIAHGRLPEQARRQQDGLPRGGQDRRGLQGRQEQGARQGVRRLPAARKRTSRPTSRARSAAGSR